jgi:hypothetical protein
MSCPHPSPYHKLKILLAHGEKIRKIGQIWSSPIIYFSFITSKNGDGGRPAQPKLRPKPGLIMAQKFVGVMFLPQIFQLA